jgi:hypothetical protein
LEYGLKWEEERGYGWCCAIKGQDTSLDCWFATDPGLLYSHPRFTIVGFNILGSNIGAEFLVPMFLAIEIKHIFARGPLRSNALISSKEQAQLSGDGTRNLLIF